MFVTFKYFGKSILPHELDGACRAALCQISPSYREQGTDVDPTNHFLRALDSIHITIFDVIGANKGDEH